MRSFHTMISTLGVILDSIKISSGMPPKTRDFLANFDTSDENVNHQGLSSEFDCSPNSGHIAGVPLSGLLSPSGSHSREINLARDIPHSSAESPSSPEPNLRARSRSPSATLTIAHVLGLKLNELRSIRLLPDRYPNKMFELRRYTFPPDGRIKLRTARSVLQAMPTGEQMVLSTSNGDVFAMLEKSRHKIPLLRALFTPDNPTGKRAKINIYTGAVDAMTQEEIVECPVGTKNPISKTYRAIRV